MLKEERNDWVWQKSLWTENIDCLYIETLTDIVSQISVKRVL